jgi:hypothetical protein
MAGGKEGGRPRGELTPDRQPEQALQGGGSKSPERKRRAGALDILERKSQLQEDRERVSQQLGPKATRDRLAMLVEYSDKEIDLGKELKAVHDLVAGAKLSICKKMA